MHDNRKKDLEKKSTEIERRLRRMLIIPLIKKKEVLRIYDYIFSIGRARLASL